MRNEESFDDAAIVIVMVAVVLLVAIVAAMAERRSSTQAYDPFIAVEPGNVGMGFTSPLLGDSEPHVRVNELPQIE